MSGYGWNGRVLRIDLSARTWDVETPEQGVLEHYLGGKGLAGRYLAEAGAREWDDPASPLLFFTGPLVGTISPTSGRSTVMARSPQTGAVGDASVGGRFGTELKRAGWDGIVVTGRAANLTGIEIRDESVVFHDARELAGADAGALMARLGKQGAVMGVGPAGENGVKFACVMADRHHAAGRGGLGCSFGRKNLKFLTVKGGGKVRVKDLAGLKSAREEIFRLSAASPVLMGQYGFTCFGTGAVYDLMHNRRMMPTENFRKTRFEHAGDMNASVFRERYAPRKHGCKGCHILCKKVAPDGTAMPEFETMSHFSALLGNIDVDLVVRANTLCNTLGMDTISAASTLACYQEISGEGMPPERILQLLEDMGRGRGLGAELGQGGARYAEEVGRPECSMSVKGLELPAYDPRGAYGMALGYAMSTRGGCHLRAYPISHEILRKPVATDRFSFSGKARIIKIAEDMNAVVDSLTACKFIFFAASLEEYAKAYSAATGVDSSAQDLLALGEKIYFHERILNARYGFSSEQDDLPMRFFTEAGSGGDGVDVPPLDREDFLQTREKYYAIRGLDHEGRPTRETADRLGLAL